ncbi:MULTISPECIES: polyprenyl synthetase family protein [Kitasatospora]|uniref:Putative polyprenyl diphosphate synthase n=1 Tax=Kitasatospora setae (strain ATCC 33774 / DSM 43861 / JCM 3304 / KCC A-0304 / NBRC 14216 / KM-6054) TaxID=452652 RepID=E4NJZ5_KITSK|nr:MULTISPECIES: polyprenyl synthetase family protein [Kitasatospora]BAJ33293.1 putative polyprenyl diphosphate synthase [Kitasatospora setae KM-6054]
MNDVLAAALSRAAGHQRRFEPRLAAHFDALADPAAGGGPELPGRGRFPARALELLRELSLRGGKRLRVALLHEAAALVTAGPVPGLDAAALSVELLHTHGLVHDDLIDDAPLRRGGPSTYYAYLAEFPDRPDTARALTVLAGDLAAFLAVRVLLGPGGPPPERALAMAAVVADAGAAAVGGQLLDLERDFPPLPDTAFLHEVTAYKSTGYSVLAPLRLGLLAAGADPAPYDRELRGYAEAVGVANQIHDDLLDLFGDQDALGKPLGTDLRAGRRSYLLLALEAAGIDPAGRTPDGLRARARAAGVEDALRAEAARHARRAADLAAGWEGRWRTEAVAFFTHLPAWSVTRDH